MIGRVTKYYSHLGVGIIAADNGRKFLFNGREMTNRNGPVSGQEVDFLMRGGRPAQIIPLSGSPWTAFGGHG